MVATVLTACGIETSPKFFSVEWVTMKLQQYLPLAVLKLKAIYNFHFARLSFVATVLTACGIETSKFGGPKTKLAACCNSTYRLRY